MKNFKDKTVLITGAGSGIGKSLALELARRGALLILSDLNEASMNQVVDTITRNNQKAWGQALDVTDEEAFKSLIDKVIEKHGLIDYIFNNAGIGIAGEVQDVEVSDWKKVFDVNLNGVMYGTVHAYKAMVKQGSGHIVNIASLEGLIPFSLTVSYVATKYAVIGLSNGLRIEGNRLGVDVSVVCPGFIRTPIFDTAELVNVDRKEFMKSLPPDALFISPDQCAKRILKGVAKNKAIIPVTGLTWFLWWLSRISPSLVIWLVSKQHAQTADSVRSTS